MSGGWGKIKKELDRKRERHRQREKESEKERVCVCPSICLPCDAVYTSDVSS